MAKEFTVTLKNAQGVLNALWAFIVESLAGGPVLVRVGRESKTRKQEKLYHKLIAELASKAKNEDGKPYGYDKWLRPNGYKADVWKVLLVDSFAKEKEEMGYPLKKPGATVPSLDNSERLVTIRPSTQLFRKSEGQEFIEFIYAKGIEYGVVWDATPEQNEAAERHEM